MYVEPDFKELQQACPGADAEFLVQCMESKWSVPQASGRWNLKQRDTIAQQQARIVELEAKLRSVEGESSFEPDPQYGSKKNDRPALRTFQMGVNAFVLKGMPRPQAVASWIKENESAYREFLDESRQAKRSW